MMHKERNNWDVATYIPHQVRPIIDCSPIKNHAKHYMWRAIVSAYIVRPNSFTLNALLKYSVLPVHDYNECVAMFVRHGDKGVEMKLLEFDSYRDTVELLWRNDMLPTSRRNFIFGNNYERDYFQKFVSNNSFNEISRNRSNILEQKFNGTFFITTEDPLVLKEADEWGKINGWNIAYTDLFDRSIQTAHKTWAETHKKGYKQVHDDLEYISMILNLQYSLKCEAWVCTLASNSCRLIDELRSTIGGKSNRVYADLSGETCKNPPCIDDGQYRYE
jgi:hypothetical protein